MCFDAILSEKELQALIRFHDTKRLFKRAALLPDARALEKATGKEIPSFITISQARKIESVLASKLARRKLPAVALDYATRRFRPALSSDPELKLLFAKLSPLEQRAVSGLAALDERAVSAGGLLCSAETAALWPQPQRGPMFVWNPKIGLGFVGPDDHLGDEKAYVWLWRSAHYEKCVYSMKYWFGVVGCSESAVGIVEEQAFGRRDQMTP